MLSFQTQIKFIDHKIEEIDNLSEKLKFEKDGIKKAF